MTLVLIAALLSWASEPAAAALGCRSSASDTDLNGDGFDDVVVGNPFATVNGRAEAGSVTVLFGDADGRIGEGARRVLTQASFAGSDVEVGDHFGWSVAVDDSNMDDCADILVGVPGEDWNGSADAGIAQLISLTPNLDGAASTVSATTISQAAVGGVVETGDQFGTTVALASSHGADNSLAAVGAPGEDVGSVVDAGAVNTFGSSYGSLVGGLQVEQGKGATPGTPEAGDRFGAALLIGRTDFPPGNDSGGRDTSFVIGAPGDEVSGHDDAGSVTTLGITAGEVLRYTQDSSGVPGAAETGDLFGSSLALSTTFAGPGTRQDVAVGSPGESVGSVAGAGSVILFVSENGGLRARKTFTQATAGVNGAPETNDHFGMSVALRPSAAAYGVALVVGVPDEDVGSVQNAGLAQLFRVGASDASLSPGPTYTENRAGTPGTVAPGNRFGVAVGAAQGLDEDIIMFSSPYADHGSVFLTAASHTTGNTPVRSWVPGRGGIPTATAGRFGWALVGLRNG